VSGFSRTSSQNPDCNRKVAGIEPARTRPVVEPSFRPNCRAIYVDQGVTRGSTRSSLGAQLRGEFRPSHAFWGADLAPYCLSSAAWLSTQPRSGDNALTIPKQLPKPFQAPPGRAQLPSDWISGAQALSDKRFRDADLATERHIDCRDRLVGPGRLAGDLRRRPPEQSHWLGAARRGGRNRRRKHA
jgi:hypothetical protein